MVNLLEKGEGCIKEISMAKFIHINGDSKKFSDMLWRKIQINPSG